MPHSRHSSRIDHGHARLSLIIPSLVRPHIGIHKTAARLEQGSLDGGPLSCNISCRQFRCTSQSIVQMAIHQVHDTDALSNMVSRPVNILAASQAPPVPPTSYYRRREEQPLSFDVKTIITIAFFLIFSRLTHSDKQKYLRCPWNIISWRKYP